MPELPEVEVIKNGLSELLPGRIITNVSSNWAKSLQGSKNDINQFVVGTKITQVRRRAKILMLDLDSGHSLVVHLKMTGQLVFRGKENFGGGHPTNSLVGNLPDKSTRVIFELQNDKLFFNDQRKFGWIKLMPTSEIPNMDFFRKVGPEPLIKSTTNKMVMSRIKKRAGSSIKAVLLDQSVIAGIGNIYADESLWCAKIHPASRVKALSDQELNNLSKCIKKVLTRSIKLGGSTDRNYVNAKGQMGRYLKFAKIFRKEGQACPRCGTILEKIRVAGRGTHICPNCQKR